MSPYDDDGSDMDRRRPTAALGDDVAEALLAGRAVPAESDLQQLMTVLRTAAAAPPPVPSAALAAVLEAGFEPLPATAVTPAPARRRRWGPQVAFAATLALTGATGATAANALPSPVQTAVADAVEALTPLVVPRPAADPDVDPSDRRRPSEAGTTGTSPDDEDAPGTTSGSDGELPGPDDDTATDDTVTDDTVTDDTDDAGRSGPGSSQSDDDEPDRTGPDRTGQDGDAQGDSAPELGDADERDSDEPDSSGRSSGGTGSSRVEGVAPDSDYGGTDSDGPDDDGRDDGDARVEGVEPDSDPDVTDDAPDADQD